MCNTGVPKWKYWIGNLWKTTCGKTTAKMRRHHQEDYSVAVEKKTSRGEGYLDRTFEEAGAHCRLSRHWRTVRRLLSEVTNIERGPKGRLIIGESTEIMGPVLSTLYQIFVLLGWYELWTSVTASEISWPEQLSVDERRPCTPSCLRNDAVKFIYREIQTDVTISV